MYALSLHSHYRSNAQDDSLAQQVEHIPFKDGVLGSSPRRITNKKAFQTESLSSFYNYIVYSQILKISMGLLKLNRVSVWLILLSPHKATPKSTFAFLAQ